MEHGLLSNDGAMVLAANRKQAEAEAFVRKTTPANPVGLIFPKH